MSQNNYEENHMADAVKDIFSALDERQIRARRPYWAFAVVIAVIAVLGSVLWYSYPREAAQREVEAAPIIRADAGPIKVVPEEPGGMNVAFRDSTVFNALQGNGTDSNTKRVENILEIRDTPIPDKEKVFSGLKTDIKVEGKKVASVDMSEKPAQKSAAHDGQEADEQDVSEAAASAETEEAEPRATAEKEIAAAATQKPAEKPQRSVQEYEQAEKLSKTEPAAGVETIEMTPGGVFVQLASLRSHEDAKKSWLSLKDRFYPQLGKLELKVQKADLGERGVFYRVQAGPVAEPQAREICAVIQEKRPGGCLVISR